MSKLITVFGATGNQGGSVIKAILADPKLSSEYKIRAITRDPSKPAAQELTKQGVEVVSVCPPSPLPPAPRLPSTQKNLLTRAIKADLNSKSSLTTALTSTHTIFLVTNYWESASRSVEVTQGKNVTDVAQSLGVKHLIFSSLLHVTNSTDGRLPNVPHFDGKAEIEEYIRASGVPATFFLPGYFMQNMGMAVQSGEDGALTWALPVGDAAKFPLLDVVGDTGLFLFSLSLSLSLSLVSPLHNPDLTRYSSGKFITSILRSPTSPSGAQVLGATAYYTPREIVSTISSVTGKKANFITIPAEVYKSFLPEFMAQEMLENHLFMEEPGYYAGKDLEENHAEVGGVEGLTTWEAFVRGTGVFGEAK